MKKEAAQILELCFPEIMKLDISDLKKFGWLRLHGRLGKNVMDQIIYVKFQN